MKVVVTGAAGDLGEKVCRHLRSLDRFQVVGVDMTSNGDAEIVTADLATFDPDWTRVFEGADAVVHLAANRRRYAPWPDLWRDNVDALLNVFEAAAQNGPMRVVFASSASVMDEYFWQPGTLGAGLVENPSTAYGASKAFGERIGKYFSAHRGLSVICLRVGDVLVGEGERPDRNSGGAEGVWGQQKWLSDIDLNQVIEKSLEVGGIDFAVINAVSDNRGMRWDLLGAERIVGYRPQSSYVPRPPPVMKNLRIGLRRWIYRLVSRNVRPGT